MNVQKKFTPGTLMSCMLFAMACAATNAVQAQDVGEHPSGVDAMRKMIIEGAAGTKPNVYLNVFGKLTRVQLTGADANGLLVSTLDNTVPIAWKDIEPKQLGSIAAEFAKTGSDDLQVVQYAVENNLADLAEKSGLAATEKDKSLKPEVAALLNKLKKPEAPKTPPPAKTAGAAGAKDAGPAAPGLDKLEERDTVSQWGVTWTFDKKVPVGQFVNGDYYVVGPVTIVALDPRPLHGTEVPDSELDDIDKGAARAQNLRNGSMLNPPAEARVAFDSGIRNYFHAELDAKLPIAMKPGDTLASSVSRKLNENFTYDVLGYTNHAESKAARDKDSDTDNCPLKTVAILTCVDRPQSPDAFRPAYCDRKQVVYLAHNLRRNLLPRLNLPKAKDLPNVVEFTKLFQKPWFNPCFFGFDEPMENMPHYGQQVGHAVSNAGVLLCLDLKPEEKEKLLIDFVQVGIDYWGMVKSGHPGWQGWGGHGSGRKFPIVFAGYLLGDDEMASPTKQFPKCNFGEDNQTRYGDCWGGAKVVFAGHSGIQSSGKAERPQWGPYEHLRPAQWGPENWRSEAYRIANSSTCWPGEALVLRILKLEKQWSHDPFFDYVDRWMSEDDTAMLKEKAKDWDREGHIGESGAKWVVEAWKLYRSTPGMPPTDGWKQKKDGPGAPPEWVIPAEYTSTPAK